ncbi:MAG: glycosyltransferase family 2 protein [Alphaproteobacteria bacterium HGW-Alphaproteobacteria-16]|nr:MAG: glycosyltransferase family 2 protein [Alphaproteobacteria bacterium HGW-Alphaproteobacteria-16]
MTTSLTVILLTHNEELHIGRALAAIAPIAQRVVVVDSGSTDATVAIAQSHGATVLHNPWINYAQQFAWALDHADITTDWVMRLDADEIIGPDLADEINAKLPALPADVAGVNLQRRHIFLDKWIKHGGRFPLTLIRIWRTGQGRIEDRWMDEHMVIWGGRTVTFNGAFSDHNLKDITFFTAKHNGYATREAIDVLIDKYGLGDKDDALSAKSASFQASLKRFVKERIYNRMPFYVSTTGYFLYRYIVQLGFLDGKAGLIYHFLQGYWYRFLVGAKVVEFEHAIAGATTKEERARILSEVSGHRITLPAP